MTSTLPERTALGEELERGVRRRWAGDLAGALAVFDAAAAREPEDARPPIQAALALLDAELPSQAQERLERAALLEPNHPLLDLLRGRALAGQGDFDTALRRFELAIARSPSAPAPRLHAARALRELGRLDEALARIADALEAGDPPARVRVDLLAERALALVSLNRRGDAAAALRELLRLGGRHEHVVRAAGILAWRHDFDGAFALLEELEPDVREHTASFVQYVRRVHTIRSAYRLYESMQARLEAHPRARVVALEPYRFDRETPLDALDLGAVDQGHASKHYLLDDPFDAVERPPHVDVSDLWSDHRLLVALERGRWPAMSSVYVLPDCFVEAPERFVHSDAQAVVTHAGRFAPGLVVQRQHIYWARVAVWDPDESAEPLDLAFVLPMVGWNEYYHLIVDALSTLTIYTRLGLSCPIVVPGPVSDLQRELIHASGVSEKTPILTAQDVRGRTIRQAVCPGFGATGVMLREWSRNATRALTGAADGDDPDEVVYVSRRFAKRRPLENEAELEEALRTRVDARIVHLEQLSLAEQAKALQRAAVIVGPHGAGLTNMLFARPGRHVVELLPEGYTVPTYAALARAVGHGYVPLPGSALDAPRRNREDLHWQIDVETVLTAIDRCRARERSLR